MTKIIKILAVCLLVQCFALAESDFSDFKKFIKMSDYDNSFLRLLKKKKLNKDEMILFLSYMKDVENASYVFILNNYLTTEYLINRKWSKEARNDIVVSFCDNFILKKPSFCWEMIIKHVEETDKLDKHIVLLEANLKNATKMIFLCDLLKRQFSEKCVDVFFDSVENIKIDDIKHYYMMPKFYKPYCLKRLNKNLLKLSKRISFVDFNHTVKEAFLMNNELFLFEQVLKNNKKFGQQSIVTYLKTIQSVDVNDHFFKLFIKSIDARNTDLLLRYYLYKKNDESVPHEFRLKKGYLKQLEAFQKDFLLLSVKDKFESISYLFDKLFEKVPPEILFKNRSNISSRYKSLLEKCRLLSKITEPNTFKNKKELILKELEEILKNKDTSTGVLKSAEKVKKRIFSLKTPK